jgi:primosomal protein N' (replication factor Y) (superfamily II helicase)
MRLSCGEMIARVALDLAIGKEFDYLVPKEFEGGIEIGCRVKVPFGKRTALGSITSLAEKSTVPNLKPLLKVLGRHALVTPRVLQLARWIAEYYCCPLETALKSVLPEAVRQEEDGWRERLTVRLVESSEPQPKLTARQQEVLAVLQETRQIRLLELLQRCRTTATTVRRLEDAGLVTIAAEVDERDPYSQEQIVASQPLALNDEQKIVLDRVINAMDSAHGKSSGASSFLLHGVTGSGKTEIYLQTIAHALKSGKGAIVLVPEISLTPQTVERFKARFQSAPLQTHVAVLHSHLSTGERHDEWHKIRQGRARIVIGARSAIFAPMEPLGLIIVDEEHESSYKQEEAPRYHARDVAVKRGQLENAVVVLGSATPSMESFYNSEKGKYQLLEMPSRVDDKKMPLVRVIDMRSEVRAQKGVPIFSRILVEAMRQRLEKKEQTMLFLNRRGYASSLQCPKCGYVAGCPNCSISLTFHRQADQLCCHICNHTARAPTKCPAPGCGNPAIRFAGIGTERVEETLGKILPTARVQRMDSDALKRKEDYRRILGDFRRGKIDILVGTQMIAKGLHFPNVTLVGIVYADLSLHMPDFRAGERTFQLLTQVAGRAGRGAEEGEVIVQAFAPFHPAIQYARRHDFAGFYDQEIEFRKQLRYPPITRVCLVTLRGRNEEKVQVLIEHVKREVEKAAAPVVDLVLAGPAAAPLLRAESYYRYQIMLRTAQMMKLSRILADVLKVLKLPDDLKLTMDIDPMNLA